MSGITDMFSSCWSKFTACFSQCCGGQQDYEVVSDREESDVIPVFEMRRDESSSSYSDYDSREKSLISRVQIIDLEEEVNAPKQLQAEAQVLEGAPESFYIGVNTPKEVVQLGLNTLPKEIAQVAVVSKHPHMTLTPPNEKLHPSKPLEEVENIQPLDVTFTEVTISLKGNINMRGAVTSDYTEFTTVLAEVHSGEATQRAPHSVIGRLDKETVEAMFKEPEKYGFRLDDTREQPLLVRDIKQPLPFQVVLPGDRPHEQRLLALSYGEGVVYGKKLERDIDLEQRFQLRQVEVLKIQSQALEIFALTDVPRCPHYDDPVQFTAVALELAKNGHPEIGRIPLTFSMRGSSIPDGIRLWVAFRGDVSRALVGNGYDDSHVSLLGSGVTGYSGNPNKPLKAWTLNSDVDCAIFSTKLAGEHLDKGGWVNTKVSMMGKYTVFKNDGNEGLKKIGFYELPVGKDLAGISLKWTKILYGEPGTEKPQLKGRGVEVIAPDEVDFKLNIGDIPFRGTAITFFALDYAKDK